MIYANINGKTVPISITDDPKAKEEAEKNSAPVQPTPTIDERVTVLEQDMADIQAAYQEGVNNA